MTESPHEIRVAPAAAKQLGKLERTRQERVRRALRGEAERAAEAASGKRGGKSAKALQGRRDRFFRLRVGDYRVMYDVIKEEKTVLVLGIVHRSDLERWLRGR